MERRIQNSHSARPVNQVIWSMWWTRTSRLSIKNSLSEPERYPCTTRHVTYHCSQLAVGRGTLSPPLKIGHFERVDILDGIWGRAFFFCFFIPFEPRVQ